jgi:flavin-binding protein dodecin
MLKRNHPTHPDREAAAQVFFKANNTLDYINWADTMAVGGGDIAQYL